MKRFLKTFVVLIACLFLLVSGLDAALDHLSHSASQSTFTVYSAEGRVLYAYQGDLGECKVCLKPNSVAPQVFSGLNLN